MALVVGSIVGLRVTGSQYSFGVQAQPPPFGVVVLAAVGNSDVLWPSGAVEAAVPDAGIDELVSPDAASVTEFSGRYVRHTRSGSTISDSAGFEGYVVQLYKRQPPGGAAGADLALVRTQAGFWCEWPVADLDVVPGN